MPKTFEGQNSDEAVEFFQRANAIFIYDEKLAEQDFNQRYSHSLS